MLRRILLAPEVKGVEEASTHSAQSVVHGSHMTMIIQNLSLNLTVKDARHSLINMLKFQRMHIKFLMVLRRL